MRHPQILLPLVFLVLCFIACGKSAGAARQELAQMNIRYTEMDFINNAREGNTGAVRLFVSAGINLEARDRAGQTALMAATLSNQPETVKLLLASAADPNAHDRYGGTALMTAAWNGNRDIALALINGRADLNARGSF